MTFLHVDDYYLQSSLGSRLKLIGAYRYLCTITICAIIQYDPNAAKPEM